MTPEEREERIEKLKQQLAEVEKAIQAIYEGAQEYRIGSRMIRRADLGMLYQERDRLEREIQVLEQGGIFRFAYFEGR